MNETECFKLLIPEVKEESFEVSYKGFQKTGDVFLISVSTKRRKEVSFIGETKRDERGDLLDFTTRPDFDLFFRLDGLEISKEIIEVNIVEGWEMEEYDSTFYYFEHLYVKNVKIILKQLLDNEYEVEIKGEIENNYDGEENIRFHFKGFINLSVTP